MSPFCRSGVNSAADQLRVRLRGRSLASRLQVAGPSRNPGIDPPGEGHAPIPIQPYKKAFPNPHSSPHLRYPPRAAWQTWKGSPTRGTEKSDRKRFDKSGHGLCAFHTLTRLRSAALRRFLVRTGVRKACFGHPLPPVDGRPRGRGLRWRSAPSLSQNARKRGAVNSK